MSAALPRFRLTRFAIGTLTAGVVCPEVTPGESARSSVSSPSRERRISLVESGLLSWAMKAVCIRPSSAGIRLPSRRRCHQSPRVHHLGPNALRCGALGPQQQRVPAYCGNSTLTSDNRREIKDDSPRFKGEEAADNSSPSAIPGPTAYSMESLADISAIVFDGIHEATLKYAIKYGEICRFENPLNLNGASGWTFVNSPELVQHVANSPNYSERYLPDVYKFVTDGKGLLGSEGHYNRKHRALCSPPFRREKYLQRFMENIKSCTSRAADPILQEINEHKSSNNSISGGGGIRMDVADLSQHLTLDIVLDVAFSCKVYTSEAVAKDSGSLDSEGVNSLIKAINRAQLLMGKVFVTPLSVLQTMRKMGEPAITEIDQVCEQATCHRKISFLAKICMASQHLVGLGGAGKKQEFQRMRTIMEPIIESRRARLSQFQQSDLYDSSGDDKYARIEEFGIENDLLTALLIAENEEGSPLSNDEIWEDVHDVTGAGHETTASTIAATLFYISSDKDVEKQVVDEIQALRKEGVELDFSAVSRLKSLEACVKEVLRLHPPIPLFPRKAQESELLPTGHRIPANDVVFMSSYSMGRNPQIWGDDAGEFKPFKRFLQASENAQSSEGGCPFGSMKRENGSEGSNMPASAQHKYSWVPFGAGPRMCLGAPFAMLSVTVAVATLLEKLKFRPIDESSKSLNYEYDITVYFPKGIPMRIESRE